MLNLITFFELYLYSDVNKFKNELLISILYFSLNFLYKRHFQGVNYNLNSTTNIYILITYTYNKLLLDG